MKLKLFILALLLATVNVSVAQNILIPAGKDGKTGYVDVNGKWVINPQFENAECFSEDGFARIRQNGKIGLIDKTGKIVVEPQFYSIEGFDKIFDDNGFARFSVDTKPETQKSDDWLKDNINYDDNDDYLYGFIDKTGKIVIEAKYPFSCGFKNGLACVKLDGKYGFIDKTGKMVIEPKYDMVMPFENRKLSLVKVGDKCGFIDKSGKMVIEPQYDVSVICHNNWSIITDSDKEGLLSADGEVLLKCQYDMLYPIPCSDVCLTSIKNKNGTSTLGIFYNGKHTVVKNVDWIGMSAFDFKTN